MSDLDKAIKNIIKKTQIGNIVWRGDLEYAIFTQYGRLGYVARVPINDYELTMNPPKLQYAGVELSIKTNTLLKLVEAVKAAHMRTESKVIDEILSFHLC